MYKTDWYCQASQQKKTFIILFFLMVIQLLAVSGSAAGSIHVNTFSSPSVILEFYFDSKACADILEFCGFGQF